MAFWWVNHKQTRDHEVRGGYLWSPMRNANGAFNQTYQNLTLVRPGDIVFSYADRQIGAIGQVTEAASASPKPSEFGTVGDYWSHEGWLVSVYFTPAPKALRPKAHIETIAPLLPTRYSPIQLNGDGNQSCYPGGHLRCPWQSTTCLARRRSRAGPSHSPLRYKTSKTMRKYSTTSTRSKPTIPFPKHSACSSRRHGSDRACFASRSCW